MTSLPTQSLLARLWPLVLLMALAVLLPGPNRVAAEAAAGSDVARIPLQAAAPQADIRHAVQQAQSQSRWRETALLRQPALAQRTDPRRLAIYLQLLAAALFAVLLAAYWLVRRSGRRLRHALTELHEHEAQMGSLLHVSRGCVLIHDANGRILMANQAAAEALGSKSGLLVGRLLEDVLRQADADAIDAYLCRLVRSGTADGVLALACGAEVRHWRFTCTYSTPANAAPHVVCQAVEITEQTRQVETLRELNLRDALTGAYNRRMLTRFEQSIGADENWAVITVDLDGFKQINDREGHSQGDLVLYRTARFLLGHVRAGDAVVRMGGDEFVLLLARANAGSLDGIAARLRRDAALAPCAFSMGYAERQDGEALAATLDRADAAMYHVKHQRRRRMETA